MKRLLLFLICPLFLFSEAHISAEFLYWVSNMTGLDYVEEGAVVDAHAQVSPIRGDVQKLFGLGTRWQPGVRIGGGYQFDHGSWDIRGEWTYFYNRIERKKSVPPFRQTASQNPLGTPFLATPWGSLSEIADKVTAKFQLRLNSVQTELGRWFEPNEFFSVRPYLSVRGAWVDTRFIVKDFINFLSPDVRRLWHSANRKQSYWGIGPLLGVDTLWRCSNNWSLFSKGMVSLLYSKFMIRFRFFDFATNDAGLITRNYPNTIRNVVYTLQPIFDLSLGLKWERPLYNGKYRIALWGGWESHLWVDFNQMKKYIRFGAVSTYFDYTFSQDGSLSLSGIFAGGRFDF